MRADTADAPELNDRGQGVSFTYDAFISYDHHDRPVAAGIQSGLHRIGRRVGQLHALRVFRDSTDLTASPDLWGKVTEAMDRSRYLIVVLSPRAAASSGSTRRSPTGWSDRGPDQLLFVVAEGQLHWDEATGRFDPDRSDAALPVLTQPGVLPPSRCTSTSAMTRRGTRNAPMFREKVTDLAAPIHGKPKYELASDDVREQRRFRRLRRAAIAGLVMLTVRRGRRGRDRDRATTRSGQQRQSVHNEAIARRLVAEAQSMLAGARSGGDVRALPTDWSRRDDWRKRRMTAHCSMRWSRTVNLIKIVDQRRRRWTVWRSAPTGTAHRLRQRRRHGAAVGRRHRPTDRRSR